MPLIFTLLGIAMIIENYINNRNTLYFKYELNIPKRGKVKNVYSVIFLSQNLKKYLHCNYMKYSTGAGCSSFKFHYFVNAFMYVYTISCKTSSKLLDYGSGCDIFNFLILRYSIFFALFLQLLVFDSDVFFKIILKIYNYMDYGYFDYFIGPNLSLTTSNMYLLDLRYNFVVFQLYCFLKSLTVLKKYALIRKFCFLSPYNEGSISALPTLCLLVFHKNKSKILILTFERKICRFIYLFI
uniref:Uncharacterized protein n=1 Tax=Heterorhabditis bacteriophora TaxID=37862 RepID=A0A1I7WKL7_HETBA